MDSIVPVLCFKVAMATRWGRAAQISGQILERYGIPLRGTGLFLYMCSRCPVRVEKFG